MNEIDRQRIRLALLLARDRVAERVAAQMDSEPRRTYRRPPLVTASPRRPRGTGPLAGRWPLACECGLVTLPGPLARHQYATGHGMLI